jgi:hypothetical protein
MGLTVPRRVLADFSTPATPPLEMTKDLSFRPSEPIVISTERQRAEKSTSRINHTSFPARPGIYKTIQGSLDGTPY